MKFSKLARAAVLAAGLAGALGAANAATYNVVNHQPPVAVESEWTSTQRSDLDVLNLAADGLATFTLKSVDSAGTPGIDTAVSYLLSTNNGMTSFSFLLSSVGASFSQFMTAGIWTMVSTSLDGTAPMPNSATTSVSAVPLPGAALLFGSALMGFFGFSNRRKV